MRHVNSNLARKVGRLVGWREKIWSRRYQAIVISDEEGAIDGTQEYAARRRGEKVDRMRFATIENLTLSPLPCWKHLSEEKRRQLIANLVAEIEAEAAAHRQRTGRQVLGGLCRSWAALL